MQTIYIQRLSEDKPIIKRLFFGYFQIFDLLFEFMALQGNYLPKDAAAEVVFPSLSCDPESWLIFCSTSSRLYSTMTWTAGLCVKTMAALL